MANECISLYTPGQDITGYATAAITGKTFLAISAAPQSGPLLNTAADGSNLSVATCTSAAKAFGVAAYDAASGAKVAVKRGGVVPVTAGGTIAVGAEVEVGSSGKAVTLSSGIAAGIAVTAGTASSDVFVALY